MALELEKRYALKVKFRRLTEDLDTIEKLAASIGTAHLAALAAVPVAASAAPRSAVSDPVSPDALSAQPFGASARIARHFERAFDDTQRDWLERFVARYNARTAKSKQFAL